MLLNEWASLAIICILGAFSPGPSLMVILSLTASEGKKAGYIASIGHGAGIFIYALLSATGLAIVLNSHKHLFAFIQILGAIFLFYLGVRIIYSSIKTNKKSNSEDIISTNFPNRFIDGFLIAILNPKIGVFFFSLFSQFLIPEQVFIIHLGMATLAGIIDTFAYLTMVSLATTSFMQRFFITYKRSVEFTFGFLLLIFSLFLCVKLLMDIMRYIHVE